MNLSLYDYMQDFDNAELNPYERQDQLEEAVRGYNEMYGTSYDPRKSFVSYEVRRLHTD